MGSEMCIRDRVSTVRRASIISWSTVGLTSELLIFEPAIDVELWRTAFCVVEIEQPHKISIIKKLADLLYVIIFTTKFEFIYLDLTFR